jgi:chromosome segregation ATPase
MKRKSPRIRSVTVRSKPVTQTQSVRVTIGLPVRRTATKARRPPQRKEVPPPSPAPNALPQVRYVQAFPQAVGSSDKLSVELKKVQEELALLRSRQPAVVVAPKDSRLHRLEQQIELLQTRLQASEAAEKKAPSSRSEQAVQQIKILQDQAGRQAKIIKDKEDELEAAQRTLGESRDLIESLRRERNLERESVERAQSVLDEAEARGTLSAEEIRRLEDELQRASESFRDSQGALEDAQRSYTDKQSEVESLKQERRSLKGQLRDLEDQLSAEREKSEKAVSRAREAEERAQEAEEERASVERLSEDLASKIKDLEKRLRGALPSEEAARLQARADELNLQFQAAQDDLVKKERQLKAAAARIVASEKSKEAVSKSLNDQLRVRIDSFLKDLFGAGSRYETKSRSSWFSDSRLTKKNLNSFLRAIGMEEADTKDQAVDALLNRMVEIGLIDVPQ